MKTLLLLFALSLAVVVNAHPAKDVLLAFNSTTQTLNLTFEHPVKDNNDHYIMSVTVSIGDNPLVQQTLHRQDNLRNGSVFYKLNSVKPGDRLIVTVECNKGGKLTRTLQVQ